MLKKSLGYLGLLLLCGLFAGVALAQGMPSSDERVSAQASIADQDDQGVAVNVNLAIDDGWHVNAHPASLEFLIATDIKAQVDDKSIDAYVTWPDGLDSKVELDGKKIRVYEDGVNIPVYIDGGELAAVKQAGELKLDVTVQACSDEGLCLPPATLNVAVKGF